MDRKERVTLTNMCMIYEGDKILVQNRVSNDWGGITFPGGHVEKGESFVASVIREVYEETGLRILKPELCGLKQWIEEDGTRYIVVCYRTNKFEGNLKSSNEGHVFWTTLPEMLKMPLSNGMENMVNLFVNDEFNEEYIVLNDGEWVDELI